MDDLSMPERALWEAFSRAQTVDLHTGDAAEDDLVRGAAWDQGRAVRAEVITELLLGACEHAQGRVPAVRLSGARITGVLDLAFAEVAYAALLRECYFEEEPLLYGAQLRRVNLARSRLPGLHMSDAQVDGLLLLDGCRVDGPVRLTGCRVTETLSLRGARLSGSPAALIGESITVGRNLVCADMVADGECLLPGARVAGSVSFAGARLDGASGRALAAEGLIAERGAFLHEGFSAQGEVRLQDARIGRSLTMAGASIRNPGGLALHAERVTVEGALYLDEGFTTEGEVVLRSSTIRGELHLAGAELVNPGGIALSASGIVVDSGVDARSSFLARGEVQLAGAHIRGWLNLEGARLINPGATAMAGDGLDVSGRFFCSSGFRAEGEVSLIDAQISGGVFLAGSTLSNPGRRALTAWGLTTPGIVNCCDGFSCDGKISFVGAQIGSELCFEEATIRADISLRQLHAAVLRVNSRTRIGGSLDVRYAAVQVLRDELDGWPEATRLDGFTYTSLQNPLPAAARLRWLARDKEGYHPQPYEHLAAVYRGMGNDADARAILYARQRVRRHMLSAPLRAWGILQDWVVGYGYRPQRAALWFTTLLIIGTAAFAADRPAPLDHGPAPEFNPFLYTLDLLVPIAGFGQKGVFNPRGWQHWLAAGLIAAGWILATTIAAGITRVLSRQ